MSSGSLNRDQQARQIFDGFLSDLREGDSISVEELVSRHPELEPELRELWAEYRELEEDIDAALPHLGTSGFFQRKQPPKPGNQVDAGQILGDCRLTHLIGRGGMGEVWEAEQEPLRRHVAVKVVRWDKMSSRALELFAREARAGARLNHPGIVSVYGTGETDGIAWIAMELVEGCWTVADFLDGLRKVDLLPDDYDRDLAVFLSKLADALDTAHSSGVIHRDLKPQNVLITPADEPKVGDFGLARVADETAISKAGEFAGSYAYMSPEQVTAGRIGIDHRTDIFSFGIVMYEMLALQRPFEGATDEATTRQIVTKTPVDPRRIRAEIPDDLAVICNKCLEKDRDRRYPTMAAIREELQRHLRGEPIEARPPGPVQKARRWIYLHRAQLAAGASIVVFALAIFLFWQNSVERSRSARARRDELYARAQYAIERNDPSRAETLIQQAIEVDPKDPTAHLILAQGMAKFSRVPERDREIQRAIDKGFPVDGEVLSTAIEHASYGLYLLIPRDVALYPEAAEHLERALELDRSLYIAHYTLYQIHSTLEDVASARENLLEFQKSLATGNPFYVVVDALLAESSGEYARACELLEELASRTDLDDAMKADLRIDRELGRNYFLVGDLDRASGPLERAARVPGDCGSKRALAALYNERAKTDPSSRWLLELRDAARETTECTASLPSGWVLAAHAEIELFGKVDPRRGDVVEDRDEWRKAQAALDALRDHFPEHPDLVRLESRLLYLEAWYPWVSGRLKEASELLLASLDLDPRALRSLSLLSDWAFGVPDHELGLEFAERALELWDNQTEDDRWETRELGRILSYGFGHACKVRELEAARRFRDRALAELGRPGCFDDTNRLNLAEFLAASELPELRDCDTALVLVEEVRHAFDGTANQGAARSIISRIENELCR